MFTRYFKGPSGNSQIGFVENHSSKYLSQILKPQIWGVPFNYRQNYKIKNNNSRRAFIKALQRTNKLPFSILLVTVTTLYLSLRKFVNRVPTSNVHCPPLASKNKNWWLTIRRSNHWGEHIGGSWRHVQSVYRVRWIMIQKARHFGFLVNGRERVVCRVLWRQMKTLWNEHFAA